MDPDKRQHMIGALGLIVLLAAAVVVVFGLFGRNRAATSEEQVTFASPQGPLHPVHVNQLDGPPRVHLGMSNADGTPITAACATCHATRNPETPVQTSADLDEFHQGLTVTHGNLSCLACHNPQDYDTLRLADGKTITYPNVMQLCAQCHGPQHRDYVNGSHGGMTGYWDRTKGPRQRNNCIDCHNAHSPAFPKFQPVFPPKDHFRPGAQQNHTEDRSHHD